MKVHILLTEPGLRVLRTAELRLRNALPPSDWAGARDSASRFAGGGGVFFSTWEAEGDVPAGQVQGVLVDEHPCLFVELPVLLAVDQEFGMTRAAKQATSLTEGASM